MAKSHTWTQFMILLKIWWLIWRKIYYFEGKNSIKFLFDLFNSYFVVMDLNLQSR